jgi:hypothetical protein
MALILPPGVTKRSVDTLVSRRVSPFLVSGTAVVVCSHGREKRSLTELAVDMARLKPHICPCCENLYTRRDDTPGMCPACEGGQR